MLLRIEGPEAHHSAFLVGKVADVVPVPTDRYLIQFSEYAVVNVAEVWKGDRNPVRELATRPHIPMLQLNNTRQGFFERPQFDAILEHAPAFLHAPLTFAFITGWRFKSEVMPLTLAQVDLQAGVVRLEPGTTKNKEGRSFYLTDELRTVLKGQLDSIETLRKQGVICPHVFHRPDGKQIKDFRALWKTACEKAGYPGKILHDFRRTAVRTLERSGVPRSTAMAMVGHKTESIYRRYAIVDEAMHREAAAKVNAYATDLKARADAERTGKVVPFDQSKTGTTGA